MAILVATLADTSAAQLRLTPADILGRWCGDQADHVISRKRWIVRHHPTGWQVPFVIRRFTFGPGYVILHWAADGDGGSRFGGRVVFTRMQPMGPTLFQPGIGARLRRC